MPIQFRCTYCNQLLSIATRKAGAVVNCPTCDARIIVPRQSEAAKISEPAKVEAGKAAGSAKVKTPSPKAGSLLEQGDFDVLLKAPEPTHDRPEPIGPKAAEKKVPPSGSSLDSLGGEVNVEPVATLPFTGTALVLTPARATVVAVVVVVLLAIAFLAGLFVGRAG
jgi:phage FluMu protein Com